MIPVLPFIFMFTKKIFWQCVCFFLCFVLSFLKNKTYHYCRSNPTFILDPLEDDSSMAFCDFDHPIYQVEDESEENCELPEELARLLRQEERVIQPHEESLENVSLGTKVESKEVKIGVVLEESVKARLIEMLQEYVDIFAWSYEDMPGLDTDIIGHHFPLKEKCPSVKQKQRRTHPNMSKKIREEVKKQFEAGFLSVIMYPPWFANIVPVANKDGKVRMCVDYQDLNREIPKDDFPLPHIDVLIDNTAHANFLSFMDGFFWVKSDKDGT